MQQRATSISQPQSKNIHVTDTIGWAAQHTHYARYVKMAISEITTEGKKRLQDCCIHACEYVCERAILQMKNEETKKIVNGMNGLALVL
jgi:hypothetical protein